MKAHVPFSVALPIVLTVLAACAGQSGSTAPAPAPPNRNGRFTFQERPTGTSRTLEGAFTVLPDTILVDASSGLCRYETHSEAGGPMVYHCADVTIAFDRRDPAMKATYTFETTEMQPQSVCAQYTTGANGAQVCARYNTQMVEQTVRHSGSLRAHRVETSATAPPIS